MALRGKVLILVENLSAPFDQRVWREATALHESGYDVSIVCPKGKDFDTDSREEIDGIAIYRYGGLEAGGGLISYGIEFLYSLVAMAWMTMRVFIERGFHVIHLCNPPDLLFLVAAPYKLLGRRVIFDHHDLSPEVYLSKRGGREKDWVSRVLLFLEWVTFKFADVVISTNESYRGVALKRGGKKPGDVFVVRNGPDLRRVVASVRNPDLKRGKRLLVAYVGTMGTQDGVDYLLRSVAYLVHERVRHDFHTLIVGGGPELERLKAYARELRIEDMVTFTGRVPDAAVMEGLTTAEVCVCPDPPTPLNNISTMNKTMEYMAMAKPVVCYDLPETRVSARDAALYAAGNDYKDFGDKMAALFDDAMLRRRLGEIGRRRVIESLSWEHSKEPLRRAYRLAFEKAGLPELAPVEVRGEMLKGDSRGESSAL